jgi:hypothetical protein
MRKPVVEAAVSAAVGNFTFGACAEAVMELPVSCPNVSLVCPR